MPLGSPVPDPFSAVTLHLESPSSDLAKYFDSRIVGGSNAPPGVAPHMVALVVGFDLSIKFFTCGASIITPRHVASAAHCISVDWNGNLMESFHGIAGTQTWNHGGIVVKFKGVSIHPQYDFISIKNDIAVLITSEKLEFNKKIHPICLDSGWVGGGVSCIVYGWGTQALWGGIPDILQMLQVKTICPKKCGNMIKGISAGWGSVPPMDSKLEICTFHSPGHGMCHGDSGSALISRKTGCLAGIVSWGFPCAVGAPDVFVRIQAYLGYIKEVIRNLH
ncbi:Chymotrypsinogen-like protein 4 [Operophtera brumata]|uniref:Chymotrypsinogen-like protein 4 n=1 Tax=Operophtera brumata TaxID=104452 RepID=A0A0L7L2A5_OPEBR|nr:Chymotrypsinogen-like protein 4 [Operophtera brumata]